ncbi:MAG TPA: hypothetical protein RMH26_04455, partial [Polyangiaceae bacterium LLY-WYZ-15_(1-7)]|nr:hypothetical protein [Polyangiaceae bacterium LLY-WYZ-15_(1-7)]
ASAAPSSEAAAAPAAPWTSDPSPSVSERTRPATRPALPEAKDAVLLDAHPDVDGEVRERSRRLTGTLAAQLGEPVRVVLTDNRRTMVSARRKTGRLEVRLHHMFLEADATLLADLARYLRRRDRVAGRRVDAFIEANTHRIASKRRRRTIVRTRGAHHDLAAIFDELVPSFREPMDGVTITWGRLTRRKRRQRSLQLGIYVPDEKLIRIHPVLDQEWVPRFYVESVVHHEMLHHALPAKKEGSRMRFHTAEFRRRERAFPRFAEAERWEKKHLSLLIATLPT